MSQDFAAHIRRVFGRYADAPVWVAWEARPHQDPSKPPIKVPINPHTGYPASVTNADTWAPAGKAIALAERRGLAGVGVVLGPDPVQNPDGSPDKPFLVGVDYDNALRPDGSLMPWAQDMMLEGTYTEISPSGTGVKAFAVVDGRPEGLPTSQDGVTLRLGDLEPAVQGKRPAVEVYTARRWFAVTGNTFRGTDECRIADMSRRMPVLLRHAAPSLPSVATAIPSDPDDSITAQDAREAYATALDRDESAALTRALQTHEDLARAMVGPDWADRSSALFAAADLAKGYRLTFAQFVHGIMAATGAAANHVREQPDPFRSLARAWDRSPQPMPVAPPGAVPANIQIGDRAAPAEGYQTLIDLSILDQPNPLGAPYTLPLDLYQNPPPLPAFILDGFFPSAPMALVGTGGVLKSTTWMALALHMILDRPVWGRNWWEGGSALMVSKEDERSIMLRRLHDLLHGLNVTERQYRDIVARRFYIDDMTENSSRMVESDGKGNLVVTPLTDFLIDKYRGRNLSMACMDPMVNFGPGEAHGNDGAALMMQVAWRMTRAWSEDSGRCSVAYIHHLSMAAARDEVEDAHAGRSASAIGDNARSVWVMHRHKVQNAHRHVAPPEIPADAIQRGEVIRMIMAKNSYAKRIMEPFYVWRENGAMRFIEAMDPEEARRASAEIPTAAEAARQSREDAAYARFIQQVSAAVGPQTLADYIRMTGLSRAIAGRHAARAVQENLLAYDGTNYTTHVVAPAAAYGF
jgi:hypothetical protein